jgi:hypothetical protein
LVVLVFRDAICAASVLRPLIVTSWHSVTLVMDHDYV